MTQYHFLVSLDSTTPNPETLKAKFRSEVYLQFSRAQILDLSNGTVDGWILGVEHGSPWSIDWREKEARQDDPFPGMEEPIAVSIPKAMAGDRWLTDDIDLGPVVGVIVTEAKDARGFIKPDTYCVVSGDGETVVGSDMGPVSVAPLLEDAIRRKLSGARKRAAQGSNAGVHPEQRVLPGSTVVRPGDAASAWIPSGEPGVIGKWGLPVPRHNVAEHRRPLQPWWRRRRKG